MKVLICGKGGSGKSTISALLAKTMSQRGYQVLVVDSDESNYGLHRQLGLELPHYLMDYFGGKKELINKMMAAYPKGEKVKLFDKMWTINDIPSEYISQKNGIKLLAIGKIHDFGEGCACPMGSLSRMFLDNLQTNGKEMVIVDTEAGIEHFGRGVEQGCDIILAVLDPSYESLQLSHKIDEISQKIGKTLYFVLNRMDEDRTALMIKSLDDAKIAAAVPEDANVFKAGLTGKEVNFQLEEIEKLADLLDKK